MNVVIWVWSSWAPVCWATQLAIHPAAIVNTGVRRATARGSREASADCPPGETFPLWSTAAAGGAAVDTCCVIGSPGMEAGNNLGGIQSDQGLQ